MSTTVSYKGQTLTTVSNDTKTLLTEGKYLEDDLTLVDVSGGGAVLTTKNISANGTYNASSDSADGYSQVTVAVPASAVDTGTKNITANGTHDVVGYASANVNVPNSYSASDEGKIVDNGALVAQTAHADVTPTTSDQTIDTTTNNSVKVKGDADLIATNIKKDVEIFGVTGSYEGGGGYTPDDFNRRLISGNIVLTSTVSASRFANMNEITGVEFDTSANDQGVGNNAFADSKNIKKIICKNKPFWIASWAFGGCTALEYAVNFFTIQANSLNGCTSLVGVDLSPYGSGENIGASAFNNSKLNTLVIRKTNGAFNLQNVSAFNGTPFASGGTGGTLYVPSALVSSYQSATNWSTILGYANNSIQAIEGSIYETQYADGTPISA